MSDSLKDRLPSKIVLTGPSGSGKSSVAAEIANRCGYQIADVDDNIEHRIRMPISAFFDRFGEAAFRAIEHEELDKACRLDRVVIATGGGVVLDPSNWTIMRPGSVIIGLTAPAQTLVERVRDQESDEGDQSVRPLLAGDGRIQMQSLLDQRSRLYARADELIETGSLGVADVADAAIEAAIRLNKSGRLPVLSINSPVERSDIYIESGAVRSLAQIIQSRWPTAGTIWLITDTNVDRIWGKQVQELFLEGGFQVNRLAVPAGESSKSFEQVASICEHITAHGATRRDIVVALGGGVVGDLAGFVAAVTLRGLSVVQIPTSLLAMVDSSVGGKTGINTSGGKNLVGAFYQPGIVIVDPDFLATLPIEEYRSGMAEVIKHSYIQPSTPLGGRDLSSKLHEIDQLTPVPEKQIEAVLSMNVAIKHSVVKADERESGLRMMLNFGHTAGHAIEADGFQYRHGEAVALGMLTVATLAEQQGRVPVGFSPDMREIISGAGLPTRLSGSASSILERLPRDKKNLDGRLHWVMPTSDGGVEIVTGIESDDVCQALRSVGAS